MITTDRLFGEKVLVPPSKELEKECRDVISKRIGKELDIVSAYRKAFSEWVQENRREAAIMAFEDNRVLVRIGNKLEWFWLGEVELVDNAPPTTPESAQEGP